jgi:outer membrane protein, heavy metal efflux system
MNRERLCGSKQSLFTLAVLLFLAIPTWASTVHIGSAQDAIQYGFENNPRFKATQYQLKAAGELPRILGSWDDPMIGVRINGVPAKNTAFDADQKRYSLNQKLPFLGKTSHKRQLGKLQLDIAQIEYYQWENKLRNDIQTAYNQLVLNQEMTRITQQNKDLVQNMARIADVKYRSGSGIRGNVLKADITRGRLEEQLLVLAHQNTLYLEKLAQLMGLESAENITVSLNYTQTVAPISDTLSHRWQDQTLMAQKVHAQSRTLSQKNTIASDLYKPDFTVQFEAWDNPGMKNQSAAQLNMNLPWLFAKNRGLNAQAVWMEKSADVLEKEAVNGSGAQVRTLISDINTTVNIIHLYESSLLKNGSLSFSSFQKAYEVDQVSFVDFFESEKMLYSLEMDYAQLLNKYHNSIAMLESYFEKGVLPNE